jgi:chemotaxis protein MotB
MELRLVAITLVLCVSAAPLDYPLSEARTASVVSWLAHGVDASRLVPQGFGATRPLADTATAKGLALNRRMEIALAK